MRGALLSTLLGFGAILYARGTGSPVLTMQSTLNIYEGKIVGAAPGAPRKNGCEIAIQSLIFKNKEHNYNQAVYSRTDPRTPGAEFVASVRLDLTNRPGHDYLGTSEEFYEGNLSSDKPQPKETKKSIFKITGSFALSKDTGGELTARITQKRFVKRSGKWELDDPQWQLNETCSNIKEFEIKGPFNGFK